MENLKIKIQSKFWEETKKWCVAIYLPAEYDYWFDSCWHKDRDKAEKMIMKKVKKHIDFVREMKKSSEERIEILKY